MRDLQKINSSDLSLGMRFSSPVFFDDGENMFLAEGKPIQEYHLEALQRWKLSYVVTYGQLLAENALLPDTDSDVEELEVLEEIEELEDVDTLETLQELEKISVSDSSSYVTGNPLVYRTGPDGFEEKYQKLIVLAKRFFETYARGETLSRTTIDQAAEAIIREIQTDAQQSVTWILNKGSGNTYAEQAVDGAFLCAAVAQKLTLLPSKLTMIVQAALIHDIAMVLVPETIRNKAGALTLEEFEILKMHTVRSGKICNDQLLFPRDVSEIVTSHHEKWDGSGYPLGRREAETDIGSRIIAVVDAFEAMTSDKTYRDPISGYETVRQILAGSGVAFDSTVVKAFVQTLGVYPVGSYVQLSDGAICKVTETIEDALFLPVVMVIRQGTGATANTEKNAIIRLNQQRQLFVTRIAESVD